MGEVFSGMHWNCRVFGPPAALRGGLRLRCVNEKHLSANVALATKLLPVPASVVGAFGKIGRVADVVPVVPEPLIHRRANPENKQRDRRLRRRSRP